MHLEMTFPPTIWQHVSFAKFWYQDTVAEAQGRDGEHSKRREIVFAACFLESYIFEYVRDFKANDLDARFPAGQSRSLVDKWRDIGTWHLSQIGTVWYTPVQAVPQPLEEILN